MNISTFNIKNTYKKDKAKIIANYLKKYDIDILCIQELTKKIEFDLRIELLNYKFYGKYRMPLSFIPYNESNKIITKLEGKNIKNYSLPHFPYFTPRLVTRTVIKYKDNLISIYNTHISYESDKIKEKQLDKIYKLLSLDKNIIILTGDFNLKNNNIVFKNFKSKLETLGIIWQETNDKTFIPSKYKRAIDHIFVSKKLKVKSIKIIKDIKISDHYPVLVEI